MNRCYLKSMEIAKVLRENGALDVSDPHEAITTYSTYFRIFAAGSIIRQDDDGVSKIEWLVPMSERKTIEVRVSDHIVGHSLNFPAGVKVENAVARIMKAWQKV